MKKIFFIMTIVGLLLLTGCKPKESKVEVTFDSNGGSAVSTITDKSHLDFDNLPESTKEGYTFLGWYIDEALTKDVKNNKPKVLELTLYAKWNINHYTITFNSNGGSVISDVTGEYNSTVELPIPTKENFIFLGWCLTNDLDSPMTSIRIPSNNLTLYAKWEDITYHVTFDSKEGTSVDSQQVVIHQLASLPTAPTKTGYEFINWYTDSELTHVFDFSTPITGDITLYAKWKIKEFTINFISYADISVTSITAEYNRAINAPDHPIRIGYSFVGWYQDEALEVPFIFDKMPGSNITLYAKWQAGEAVLTFDSNGGSVVEPIRATVDSVITKPNNPTKTGYDFVGWYTNSELTDSFTVWEMPQSDTTLYAKWTEAQVSIIFDTQGGSEVPTLSAPYLSDITKPEDPTKEGYLFDGWYIDDNFNTLFTFNKMPAEDITLYASWINTSEGMTISYIKTKENNTEIIAKGVVISKLGDNYSGFYISDHTGQIFVNYNQSLVSIGDEIRFSGNYLIVNGIPMLANVHQIETVSEQSPIEPPTTLTIDLINGIDENNLQNYAKFLKTTGYLRYEEGFYYLEDGLGNSIKISHYSYMPSTMTTLQNLTHQFVELNIVLHEFDDEINSWVVTYEFESIHSIELTDAEKLAIVTAYITHTYQNGNYRPNDSFIIPTTDVFSWSTISYQAVGTNASLFDPSTKKFLEPTNDTTVDFEVTITIGTESTTLPITIFLNNSVLTILEFINVTDSNYYTIIGTVTFVSEQVGFALLSDETGTIYINNSNFSIGDIVKLTSQKSSDNHFVYIDSFANASVQSRNISFDNTPSLLSFDELNQLDETDPTIYGQYVETRAFLEYDEEQDEFFLYNDDYSIHLNLGSWNAREMIYNYIDLEIIINGYILYKNDEMSFTFFGYRDELSIPEYTDEELVNILQKLFLNEYTDHFFNPYDTFELPPYHYMLGGEISWSYSNETLALVDPDTNQFIEVEESQPVQINIVIKKNQSQLTFTYTTTLEPFKIYSLEELNGLSSTTPVYIKGVVLYHNDDYTFVMWRDSIIKVEGDIPAYKGDIILVKVYLDFDEYEHVAYIDRYDFFFKVYERHSPVQIEAESMTIAEISQYSDEHAHFYNDYIEVKGLLKKNSNGKLILTDGTNEVHIMTSDQYAQNQINQYLEQNIKIKAYVRGYNRDTEIWTVYFTGLYSELEVIPFTDQEKQDIIQTYLTNLYQNQNYIGDDCITFVTSHPFIPSTVSYTAIGDNAHYVDIENEYINEVSVETKVHLSVSVTVNDTINTFTLMMTILPYGSNTKEIISIADFKNSNGEFLTVQGVIISVGNGYFLIEDETGRIFVETSTYYYSTSLNKRVEITGTIENVNGRLQIDEDHQVTIVAQNQFVTIGYPDTDISDIVKNDFYDESQYGKSVTITGLLFTKMGINYQTNYYITDGYDTVMIDCIQSYYLYEYVGFEISIRGFLYGDIEDDNDVIWTVNVITSSRSLGDYTTEEMVDIVGNRIVDSYNNDYYQSYSEIYLPTNHNLLYNEQITYQVMNESNLIIDFNNHMIGAVDNDSSFEIKLTITINDISKDFFFTINVRGTTHVNIDDLENPSIFIYDDVTTRTHYFYGIEGTKYYIQNGNVYVLDNYYVYSNVNEGDFVYVKGVKNVINELGGFGYDIRIIDTGEHSEEFAIESTLTTFDSIYNSDPEILTKKYLKVYGQLLYDEIMDMYYITDGNYKLYIRSKYYQAMIMDYQYSDLENHLYNELYLEVLFPNIKVRGDVYLVDYKQTDTSLSYPELTPYERVVKTLAYLERMYDGNTYISNDELWLPNYHAIYNTSISWSTASTDYINNTFQYVSTPTTVTFDVTISYGEETITTTITVYVSPPNVSTIYEVLRGYLDEKYTVQGIVVAYDTWYYRLYIQDETGIILIDNYWEGIEVGDEIIVSGYRGNNYFANIPILSAYSHDLIKILSHGNPIVEETPTVLTIDEVSKLDYTYPDTYAQRVTVTGVVQKVYYTYFLQCDGYTINIDYTIDGTYDGSKALDQLLGDEITFTGYLIGFEIISNTRMWLVTFSGDPNDYQVITNG